jgi:acyl dehydratase
MAQSLITEEMKRVVGVPTEPTVIEIDKSAILRFCEAVGDPNPMWLDGDYARSHRYGGIVAPPTFLAAARLRGARPTVPHGLKRVLDGGGEWEFFRPVRLGDVLTVTTKVIDLTEREGKMGKMLFIVTETTWKNQSNELVAKAKGTSINY